MKEILGTKPHKITPKHGLILAWEENEKTHAADHVIMPSIKRIPVPKLVFDVDGVIERNKFRPLPGSVVWNYNDTFKGEAKITEINYHTDYDRPPTVTIEAVILNRE